VPTTGRAEQEKKEGEEGEEEMEGEKEEKDDIFGERSVCLCV
jgi:hypothetical protein